MTELVRYEAARKALAEAVAVDEVVDIRSKAEAMRVYARQASDKGLEIQAAQIRFRAERRLGEMIVAQKETVGLNTGSRGQLQGRGDSGSAVLEQPEDERPRLADIGVDRKLSSKAQKLAAMDAAEFEHALARHKQEMESGAGRVAMDLLKIDAEEKGRTHRRDLASAMASVSALVPDGKKYPASYSDPPWVRKAGVGNRAYENHYTTMPWPEILKYLERVGEAMQPDAWHWMWIPRAHLLAKVPYRIEVVLADGEVVMATSDLPLAYACQLALGMDSYSTCYVWTKTDEEHPDVSGTGLLVWDQDELLLQFKRGKGLPKPASDEKFGSNHRERPREHSRKPDHYRHMIATMVGKDSDGAPLPVLELFARVDAEHPLPANWDAWGNQAGVSLVTPQHDSNLAVVSPSGEVAAAAAEGRACPAAAVEPPYNAGDVIAIDQLAGAEWLAPPFDPASLGEREALTVLSDFCHKRRDVAPALGEFYLPRGFAYRGEKEWSLTGRGWDRLRELQALDAPAAPRADLTEPYRAPQPSLFDVARQLDDSPPAEVVDGALQTRLPVDDDELTEQLALLAIDAGDAVEPQLLRHLVGKGFAHCGTTKISVTDDGRAFLAQLVGPVAVQQQGEIAR